MARITFPDGRWVDLRPMYVDDELAFEELAAAGSALDEARQEAADAIGALDAEAEDADAQEAALSKVQAAQALYYDWLRRTRDRMQDATTATSWDGPLGARVMREELSALARQWRRSSEDAALPPG